MTNARNVLWILGGVYVLFAGLTAYDTWLRMTDGEMSFGMALLDSALFAMVVLFMYVIRGIPVGVPVLLGWKRSGRLQHPWRRRCIRTGLVALLLTPADAGTLGWTPAMMTIGSEPLRGLISLLVVWGVLLAGVAGSHWLQARRRRA